MVHNDRGSFSPGPGEYSPSLPDCSSFEQGLIWERSSRKYARSFVEALRPVRGVLGLPGIVAEPSAPPSRRRILRLDSIIRLVPAARFESVWSRQRGFLPGQHFVGADAKPGVLRKFLLRPPKRWLRQSKIFVMWS